MEVSPEDLYKDFMDKTIDKDSLTEQLSSIIENSRNLQVRVLSIQILGKIELNSNSVLIKTYNRLFDLLENLIISDSNELIRNEAAILLYKIFKTRSLIPMKWALLHDESPRCLKTIHLLLMEIISELNLNNKKESYSILRKHVIEIEDKDFRIDIESNLVNNNEKYFSKANLIKILTNYFTFIYLRKAFWRIKYRIMDATLVELDFSFKVLTKLPQALKFLKFLKKLTLKYNQIMNLPEWIGELSSLEQLNLNINNIATIPTSISSLTQLKELYLWKNELESLPESIGNLKNLKKLNLRLNQLRSLPNALGNLSNLRELDLHDNKLVSLPESISHLKCLEVLNLSWNLLNELPQAIYNLSSLKVLDLGRNELKALSSAIDHLLSMEILDLSENKLRKLPQTIGNLHSLKVLNLSRNELRDIPISISNIPLLEELYLVDNYINELPSNFYELEEKGLKIII
jgi:Leucine-rich repeat (LRR) protein